MNRTAAALLGQCKQHSYCDIWYNIKLLLYNVGFDMIMCYLILLYITYMVI